eukprot:CAMPEP_0179090866 /NCGR_PEP_ID=MMETSP0796-20121207/41476_1 /TAXON_ID=73915 /ORGANISM="Pyrodinium bahamense, Strain pbaha01" /LENGTH=252 /DNA_ID=CAMNT_0020788441 /DNA_START=54 /DNA_END=812 /DNA_ORIENTATION=-
MQIITPHGCLASGLTLQLRQQDRRPRTRRNRRPALMSALVLTAVSAIRHAVCHGAFIAAPSWRTVGSVRRASASQRAALAPAVSNLPTVESQGHEGALRGTAELSAEDRARLRLASGSNLFALTTQADLDMLLAGAAQAGQLVVVDYYAPWCRACRQLLRHLERIAQEMHFHNVLFASVDYQQSRDLCTAKAIDKFPTVEIYRGDALRQRWSGSSKKRLLERLGEEVLEATNAAADTGANSTMVSTRMVPVD